MYDPVEIVLGESAARGISQAMSATLDAIEHPDIVDSVAPPEVGGIYELIREDILEGRLAANERLKVSALAAHYGTSTNPVREALQQLRGEGFVIFSPNRGARVRGIDETFVRDIYEMEVLVEPFLTRWFVGIATDTDIDRIEAIQSEIEALNFSDLARHSKLDTQFHRQFYDRHYNRHALALWWKHREILSAINRGHPMSIGRRTAVIREHRGLIAALKAHDADSAAEIIETHVRGSGQHIIEQMRARAREATDR
jgi:DNA-binding GntR family transcriptional regulator